MRAVVDTNMLVRAVIKPRGSVAPLLHRLRDGAYTLAYSKSLIDELVDVLNRGRIRHRYGVDAAVVAELLRLIALRGEAVSPVRQLRVCRDPRDDKFLEAAVDGSADVIVSGDEDLLVLSPFEGIPTVGAARFLEMIERERQEQEER
jgi:putative PIN family toxin of toxin-antitoxin system